MWIRRDQREGDKSGGSPAAESWGPRKFTREELQCLGFDTLLRKFVSARLSARYRELRKQGILHKPAGQLTVTDLSEDTPNRVGFMILCVQTSV